MSEKTFRVVYGNPPQETAVSTPDELDQVLDAEHARAEAAGSPTLVHIDAPDGTGMMVGLGRPYSPLVHEDSHVPGELDGGQPTAWLDLGEYSELPAGMAVPTTDARYAAREFVQTARRPENLTWSD